MKRFCLTAAVAAAFFCGAALADPVVHLACKHVSGGTWWNPAFVTIDGEGQEVTSASSRNEHAYAQPADIAITDTAIHWSWMRGFVDFDRKSGRLDWDMRSEYDYLDAIGQKADEPRDDYTGRMQCAVDSGAKP